MARDNTHPALTPSREIVVRGGEIESVVDGKQVHTDNRREFIFGLAHLRWRMAELEGAESVAN